NPSKTVPVSVETTGELPEGFSLESISANLDEAEIFATSEILAEIEAVTKEEIDLSEVTESGTMEVELALPEGVITEELETIEVTVEVEETRTLEAMMIEEEGLEEGQAVTYSSPEGGEMEITVTGNQSIVSELGAGDFRLFIDLSNLEPGEHLIPISVEWDETEDIEMTGEYEEASIIIE